MPGTHFEVKECQLWVQSCWPPVQNSVSPGQLRWSLWNPRWLKPAVTKALKITPMSPYLCTSANAQHKKLSTTACVVANIVQTSQLNNTSSKFRSETLLTFSQIASPKISIRSRDAGENSFPRYTPNTVMWNGILCWSKDKPPPVRVTILLLWGWGTDSAEMGWVPRLILKCIWRFWNSRSNTGMLRHPEFRTFYSRSKGRVSAPPCVQAPGCHGAEAPGSVHDSIARAVSEQRGPPSQQWSESWTCSNNCDWPTDSGTSWSSNETSDSCIIL